MAFALRLLVVKANIRFAWNAFAQATRASLVLSAGTLDVKNGSIGIMCET
jgi:hypothetical protein